MPNKLALDNDPEKYPIMFSIKNNSVLTQIKYPFYFYGTFWPSYPIAKNKTNLYNMNTFIILKASSTEQMELN